MNLLLILIQCIHFIQPLLLYQPRFPVPTPARSRHFPLNLLLTGLHSSTDSPSITNGIPVFTPKL